ncbi:MAG: ABC transporter permease [Alphaproteobacteria bacterium]|nr:ABC transporter permease [Alphaproteobacteria bacterium]
MSSDNPSLPATPLPRVGQQTAWRDFLSFTRQRGGFQLGLAIVALSLGLAVFGPHIGPYPTETALPGMPLQPPSWRHWMGTDVSNMDIFSRVIAAPRIDLTIALVSTAIAFAGGVALGVISGFFGGGRGVPKLLSEGIMRAADIIQAFPVFIFALALVGFRGPGTENVIAALAFLNIPYFLRITRGAVLQVRERPFVEAQRCAGNSEWRIAFVHVMPNALTPPLANISPTIGFSILLTSGLSFVGAGVPVPTPEWGSMIAIGAPNMMTGQWWTALFPGLVLGIVILGYALVGDGLKEFLDPVNKR